MLVLEKLITIIFFKIFSIFDYLDKAYANLANIK